ncbi:hypothetical protein BST33_01150 [Mycolicibacter minnesotensis]|uniref:Uncharacterized protein n=1 Tax=Mycolicibacter minnesotensis TaxID=1118379 RepID=A0A7I7R8V9_9MYCO|nr:hypothetical protein [Mycolicibacter minnesotensis]ORB04522.1 hypothetical protein BST33_01150 [Mycolicibacter minnesotensis]BBY35128.1 hypothetical protein MMIN_31890 [Mycolicibacter minnesotensis]
MKAFLGREAVAAGVVSRYRLQRRCPRIFPGVYLPADQTVASLRDRIGGAWLWSGRRGIIAGVAASALHGARWVDDGVMVEMLLRNGRPPNGVVARNEVVASDDELTFVGRLPVTTPARTAFDLGRHLPRGQALARLDALMRATPFDVERVAMLADRYPGARGLRQLRELLPLVDGGAASPKETWLRLLLLDAGFPTPTTQIPLHINLHLFAVLDMGWEDYRVAAEYDGDQHRTDRREYVRGERRQRKLPQLGWINIKVIAEDRPDEVIDRVYRALQSRGWRGTLNPRLHSRR